jgi:hypothetical protein
MPATVAGAVVDRDPRVAKHSTPFKGVVATFTKIDKANGSAGTSAAGTVTQEQETPQFIESRAIAGNFITTLLFCWLWFFVSTVFPVKCNTPITDMTKRGVLYFSYVLLMFQHSAIAR